MRLRSLLLPLVLMLALPATAAQRKPAAVSKSWHFAVAGDSRNCGDVVMPILARGIKADNARFYWHLGDFRAIYKMDEDMVQAAKMQGKTLTQDDYFKEAWPDTIEHQLLPFKPLPVYAAIGNHETYAPMTRAAFTTAFSPFLDQPAVRRQRLADDPADTAVKTYYHWVTRGIDFITLDNASCDMFDEAQMAWFNALVDRDAADRSIRTVVVGMHEALPESRSCGHSMGEYPKEQSTGRDVYSRLIRLRDEQHKQVYVLASHSHFVMENVYDSAYWQTHGGVLTGWIVGTSGAVRYRLPTGISTGPGTMTDVYGYLLATVDPPGSAPGTITFKFRKVEAGSVPLSVRKRYSKAFVEDVCFANNKNMGAQEGGCPDLKTCKP